MLFYSKFFLGFLVFIGVFFTSYGSEKVESVNPSAPPKAAELEGMSPVASQFNLEEEFKKSQAKVSLNFFSQRLEVKEVASGGNKKVRDAPFTAINISALLGNKTRYQMSLRFTYRWMNYADKTLKGTNMQSTPKGISLGSGIKVYLLSNFSAHLEGQIEQDQILEFDSATSTLPQLTSIHLTKLKLGGNYVWPFKNLWALEVEASLLYHFYTKKQLIRVDPGWGSCFSLSVNYSLKNHLLLSGGFYFQNESFDVRDRGGPHKAKRVEEGILISSQLSF